VQGSFQNDELHLQSGKPLKIVYSAITDAQPADVVFDFKDLPLPQE
jgi:hypothetical protein